MKIRTKNLVGVSALCLAALMAAPSPGAPTAGAVDQSFMAPTNLGTVLSLAVQPDGKIVVGGGSPSFGVSPVTFARLQPDGSLDSSFHPGLGPNGPVSKVLLLSDGEILIAGAFTSYDSVPRPGLALLHPDGSLNPRLTALTIDGPVNTILVQPDGKWLITGGFSNINAVARMGIARLHSDGTVDATFDPGRLLLSNGTPVFYTTLLQRDGRVVVGGSFGDGTPGAPLNLSRLNADGSLDDSFRPPELLLPVFALALLPDGNILVGGEFWSPAPNLIRLLPDGQFDETFDAAIGEIASDPIVDVLLVQPDGRILLGGRNIRTAGGLPRRLLARIMPDGTGDPNFDPGAGPNRNGVFALALHGEARLYAGGSFTAFDGVPSPGVVRLHNDGFADRIYFSASDYSVMENAGTATITFQRLGNAKKRLRAQYHLERGTAQPGRDYRPSSGSLVFNPGENTKTVTIFIRDDREPELEETILLRLRHVGTGDEARPARQTSTLRIVDNDSQ